MDLILIRHGLPEKVVRDDGGAADPELSATGHLQAQKMAEYLQSEPIAKIYSSPMRRAAQTAEPLASLLDLPVTLVDGVAEYDQQADHYIPVEQLKEENYEAWKALMRGDLQGYDFEAFVDRAIAALNDIIANHRGETVAVTCHGGIVNVWAAHVLGMTPRMFFNPYYTSISRFRAASSGEKSVITLNERHHVRDEV
ncbi:MAG: histidine phosphatase family protein [Pseudomonadales bacterium]